MIFITVGTHDQQFDRLIIAADHLQKLIDEEVIIQWGYSNYSPIIARGFQWLTNKEMETLFEQARIIISHAGAGTIILASKYNKPNIIVPRLSKYKEHVDDHQLQLAIALTDEKKAVCLLDVNEESLKKSINDAEHLLLGFNNANTLIENLKKQINEFNKRKNP